MTNKAQTTLEIFSIVQDLRCMASSMLKNPDCESRLLLEACNITPERLEKLQDFYTSEDWEITE